MAERANGPKTGYRLNEIVARFGGVLIGDGALLVSQVATLEHARPDQISFLANPKYQKQLKTTSAGAVILGREAADSFKRPRIVCDNPYAYFARVAQLLNPQAFFQTGVHPSAVVDTVLHPSVSVGVSCHVGPDATIGEGTVIDSGCVIGSGVSIGAGSLLHANVTVYPGCVIGARAIIHSGAVIGADGFGIAREEKGN